MARVRPMRRQARRVPGRSGSHRPGSPPPRAARRPPTRNSTTTRGSAPRAPRPVPVAPARRPAGRRDPPPGARRGPVPHVSVPGRPTPIFHRTVPPFPVRHAHLPTVARELQGGPTTTTDQTTRMGRTAGVQDKADRRGASQHQAIPLRADAGRSLVHVPTALPPMAWATRESTTERLRGSTLLAGRNPVLARHSSRPLVSTRRANSRRAKSGSRPVPGGSLRERASSAPPDRQIPATARYPLNGRGP